jgi:hypothetical protein
VRGRIRTRIPLIMELLYKEEYYNMVGVCMEIHRILGRGLSEIVYKDAMEFEFR